MKKKTGRYATDKRKKLLAQYDALRAEGKTTKEASTEVGVPYITLRSWVNGAPKKKAKVKKVVATPTIQDMPAAPKKTLPVLTLEDGRTIRADIEDLIKILKSV